MSLIGLRMPTGTKRRQDFGRNKDFLNFGRAYFSEAFPNPDRTGCPPDELLRLLASNPTTAQPWIADHVTCCSPCFNDYMTHLGCVKAEAAQARSFRFGIPIAHWLGFATVAVVLVIAYAFFSRGHNSPTATHLTETPPDLSAIPSQSSAVDTYVSVVVDLSNASPQRGAHKNRVLNQVIPSSALLDLNVLLPIGSEEGVYSMKLSSRRRVVWSGSAKAYPNDNQMCIRIHADFSHVPTGNYELVVMSKEFRLAAPVVLKNAPSERSR